MTQRVQLTPQQEQARAEASAADAERVAADRQIADIESMTPLGALRQVAVSKAAQVEAAKETFIGGKVRVNLVNS